MSSTLVYTALFGRYEPLAAQIAKPEPGVDYICFTDDPELKSDFWEIKIMNQLVPGDSTRSARWPKIAGPLNVANYDRTLWIDNRIQLKERATELIPWLLGGRQIGMFTHCHRKTVLDEFHAVRHGRFDNAARIRETCNAIKRLRPETLAEAPMWTAIIARRSTPLIAESMQTWLAMVLRYSRRDQLSVNFSLGWHGIVANAVQACNFNSEWHRWYTPEELPKAVTERFSKNMRYSLTRHALDDLTSTRVARYLRRKVSPEGCSHQFSTEPNE